MRRAAVRALAAGADVNYLYVSPAAAALVAEVNAATAPPRADLPPGASGVTALHLAAQVRILHVCWCNYMTVAHLLGGAPYA